MPRFSVLALVILPALAATFMLGCGVQFGNGEARTQPLANLRVLGTPVIGQELLLQLDYSQNYPLAVDVECRVKQNGNVLQIIGDSAVPANPDGNPEATPMAGSLFFPFHLDQPGVYEILCLTTANEDNKLSRDITIHG
ncbi:MAG: hypothetical protein ABR978_08800 [Dehalococcoidia bacterium]|jgi:hypothetical protein